MKIQKLDRRHTGKIAFKYYVSTTVKFPDNTAELHSWRVWCWENFGPGAERDLAVRLCLSSTPVRWAWYTEHGHNRLYFNEAELVFFKLKWV